MGKGNTGCAVSIGGALHETDQQLLQLLGSSSGQGLDHPYTKFPSLRSAGRLVSSALLEASSGKQYRGHIGVVWLDAERAALEGFSSASPVFVGWTTYGKTEGDHHSSVVYSDNMKTVLGQINKKLKSKLSASKGYEVVGNGPTFISRDDVVQQVEALKQRGYLG